MMQTIMGYLRKTLCETRTHISTTFDKMKEKIIKTRKTRGANAHTQVDG